MSTSAYGPAQRSSPERPRINAARLWTGGLATAAVAGLVVVVGVLAVRGILSIPILAPEGHGTYGNVATTTYALTAVVAALVATALLHLLLIAFPQPTTFFSWIAGLATVAATLFPFTRYADLETQIASAAINLVVGITIVALLSSLAWSVQEPRNRPGATH